jgi:hypothetical protein
MRSLKLSLHEIVVSGCMMLKETVLACASTQGAPDQGNFGNPLGRSLRRV